MRGLVLFPLPQLNAALVAVGQKPVENKTTAIAQLETLVNSGLISFDQIKNIAPLPPVSAVDPRIDQIVNDLSSVKRLVHSGLNEVSDIRRKTQSLQGVDYSKLVVFLAAAIQEQQAAIVALEARLAALEPA